MLYAANRPIESLGGGLYEIEPRSRGCYVQFKGASQLMGVPFSAINYRCGNDTKQCKSCPSYDKCYPQPKK